MSRATVGGWVALWLALTIPGSAAADFRDGVRAYNSGDYAAAHAVWLPLAEAGDAAAARNLGHLYRTGRGVDHNLAQALRWYRRAAEQGLAGAQANLGDMFARGQGVAKDYTAAALWFHRAAVQGHVAAQFNLGLLYENGLGVEANEGVAMAWYHRAAGAGHQGALERLSLLVTGGANPASAAELALAPPAEPLEPSGDRLTGVVEASDDALSVADRLGMARAAFRASDYASALEAWGPLAEAGNPIAQFHLGRLYADGTGVVADVDEARRWWALAAAQGHDRAAQLLAALASGAPSATRLPTPAEEESSTEPTRAGATPVTQPSVPAPGENAALPAEVDTVPDLDRLAAMSGAERLAAGVSAYRSGGFSAAATAWLPLAEAGNAWAQFYLGGLYHDGDGVEMNLSRAHVWWTLAARGGHQAARTLLAELEPRMDADARAEAEALAAVWQSRE